MKEYVPGRRREIYVRDAQGNVLAVYEAVGESLFTKEYYFYGVKRLGYLMKRRYLGRRCAQMPCGGGPRVSPQEVLGLPPGIGRSSVVADDVEELRRGAKRYELSDWLGNVRVVVTDERLGSVGQGYRAEVVGRRDYYNYGQDIGERRYSLVDAYRYSFNGKEDVGERRWWQDYGARMYHRVLGRFVSADPLIVGGKGYAWLSSYQFASSTPIAAIDADGLEACFVHGTWSSSSIWSPRVMKMISKVFGAEQSYRFRWSGYNTDKARREAAERLVGHILATRGPNQPLVIVGHSHGGNVGILAANMLAEKGVKVDRIVTINTPVREYELKPGVARVYYNIYNSYDLIQAIGGGKFNIPDEVKKKTILVNERFGVSISESKSCEGKEAYLSGEVGLAGSTFEGAVNVKYFEFPLFTLTLGHQGYLPAEVKEWLPKVRENELKLRHAVSIEEARRGGQGIGWVDE